MTLRSLAAAALLPAVLAVLGAAPASATTSRPRLLPPGETKALALSGNAIVVAHPGKAGSTVVERRAPGAEPVLLLRLQKVGEIAIAASPEAVAVTVQESVTGRDYEPTRVLVGPPTGPLREVASCVAALSAEPVAVDGPRVAWGEGGCGTPADRPRETTDAAVAVGAADPAVPVRRSPIAKDRVPVGLALAGDSGLVGSLRPSLFTFVAGELRAFGPGRTSEPVLAGAGDLLSPVGLLADGRGVLLRQAFDFGDGSATDEDGCDTAARTVAGDGSGERALPLAGRCPADADGGLLVPSAPLVTTRDRAVALVEQRLPRRDPRRGEATQIFSVTSNGSDLRVLSRARYRTPLGLAAAPDRVAWWQPTCTGGTELVESDPAPPRGGSRSVPSCRAELLDRRVRLRGRTATLRLRCRLGCIGEAIDDSTCRRRWIQSFSYGRGIHRLRFTLPRSTLRRGRLLLRLDVRYGPSRRMAVRLRR